MDVAKKANPMILQSPGHELSLFKTHQHKHFVHDFVTVNTIQSLTLVNSNLTTDIQHPV